MTDERAAVGSVDEWPTSGEVRAWMSNGGKAEVHSGRRGWLELLPDPLCAWAAQFPDDTPLPGLRLVCSAPTDPQGEPE